MYVKNDTPNYIKPPYPKTPNYHAFCIKDAKPVESKLLPKKESEINSKQSAKQFRRNRDNNTACRMLCTVLGHSDIQIEGR